MLGLSCQMRAQRIVHAIRKPRNNADEAIGAKPGWAGATRDLFRGSLMRYSPTRRRRLPSKGRRCNGGSAYGGETKKAQNPTGPDAQARSQGRPRQLRARKGAIVADPADLCQQGKN